MAVVYILYSETRDRFYVGSTTDLNRRMGEHQAGHTPSTKSGRPWRVAFLSDEMDFAEARKIEAKIKRYKSRLIIEKIVKDGFIV